MEGPRGRGRPAIKASASPSPQALGEEPPSHSHVQRAFSSPRNCPLVASGGQLVLCPPPQSVCQEGRTSCRGLPLPALAWRTCPAAPSPRVIPAPALFSVSLLRAEPQGPGGCPGLRRGRASAQQE